MVLVIEDDRRADPLVQAQAVLDGEAELVVLDHQAAPRGLGQSAEAGDEAVQ